MGNNNQKKKLILLVSVIALLLVGILGVTFAFFSYTKLGANQQLVAGDIYMYYNDTNEFNVTDMTPRSAPKSDEHFDFTIKGKNQSLYDIIYDINVSYGNAYDDGDNDPSNDKVRIRDEFLRFRLDEKIDNGEWITKIQEKKYNDFEDGVRIYVDQIDAGTNNETTHYYRLYVWISDEIEIYSGDLTSAYGDYSVTEWEKLYASFKVNVTGDFSDKRYEGQPPKIGDLLSPIIAKKLTMTNDVPDNYVLDGTDKYISGCKEDAGCDAKQTIDFNYVWYSGKLWRVVAIYGDNTMKLVTEDTITSIYWGSNTTYNGSWVYQWLNEDFADTLVNKSQVIASSKEWNATETKTTTKPAETTMVEGNVGMLNAYEYTNSYTKAGSYDNGYLNIGLVWWLITPYGSSYVRHVNGYGYLSLNGPSSNTYAVRPSIYLKSSITFAGGNGSKNNPYRIGEDISAPTANANINTRVSGEYVTFKNELFRIVGREGDTTKIVKADYLKNGSSAMQKKLSTSITYGSGTSDTYWDYYLNNTWLTASDKNLLDEGTYYLGEYGDSVSYKKTICSETNNTGYTKTIKTCDKLENTQETTNVYTGYAGLLRVGEMFSSQLKTTLSSYQYMWLITPYSSSRVRDVNYSGDLYYGSPSSSTYAVRPSVNLKSNIIITDGSGTEQDPFEIGLPA